MKYFFVFYLFFSFLGSLFSQDYQPFKSNLTYEYINVSGDSIRSLRIKNTEGDATFIFNPRYDENTRRTVSPIESGQIANNVFGARMVVKKGGDFIFISSPTGYPTDTLLVKTHVAFNKPWTFCKNPIVIGMITEKFIANFLSIKDSALRIALSDGNEIIISKNYGIIKSPTFIGYVDKRFRLNSALLNGLTDTQSTLVSDPRNIFNFEKGDIFGYMYYYYPAGSTGRTKIEILERYDSPSKDSIKYKVEVNQGSDDGQVYSSQVKDYFVTKSSSNFYGFDPKVTLLSGELGEYPVHNIAVVKSSYKNRFMTIVDASLSYGFSTDTVEYVLGLGLVKRVVEDRRSAGTTLVCYIKGDERFGNCDNLLQTEEISNIHLFNPELSPNPTKDILQIQFYSPNTKGVEISIDDMLSNNFFRFYFPPNGSEKEILDTSFLNPGLYLVTFRSSTSKIVKKLIIAR